MPRLVARLDALDYPTTKLDVKLLLEEDDEETSPPIRGAATLPPHFQLVVVPDSQPKTKPKACNYGLLHARGDVRRHLRRRGPARARPAEEGGRRVPQGRRRRRLRAGEAQLLQPRPEPAHALVHRPSTRCGSTSSCPALDATERADPARRHLQPLRHRQARELGAWDPFNVTEDADLGIRLYRAGYRTAMIDSTTLRGGQLRGLRTGSGSARAGSRATSRPGSCTCATRSRCCRETRPRAASSASSSIVGGTFVLAAQPDLLGADDAVAR